MIRAVIGANFGDEGKGKTVDYFASQTKSEVGIVVCTNGGSQRGHNVVTPQGEQHIFKHFGSGVFSDYITYLPKQYIINPMQFYVEHQELMKMGYSPVAFVNRECLCSTPFDMMINQIIEQYRLKKHGSCGFGIWETILRKGITFEEMIFMSNDELEQYLKDVRDVYSIQRLKTKKIEINNKWGRIFFSDRLIKRYINDFRYMVKYTELADDNCIRSVNDIIFENGQGLALDQNIFDSKYSTPSNTGSKNIKEILDAVFKEYSIEVCYVTRTYLTRHGEGILLSEDNINNVIKYPRLQFESNHYNEHQGNFRYGILDINDLQKRVDKDFNTYWNNGKNKKSYVITHLDEQNIDLLKLSYNGNLYKSFGVTRNETNI